MLGTVVGNYRITEKIGEGGMGEVFRGVDLELERDVAIKMLRPELARQQDVVERFRAEARALAKLNHPNIATLYSFLQHEGDYFMVMEFVRGESLDVALRRFGAMSCERAVPLFCQALDGMEQAHRLKIIHRDIKPGNIMLTDTGSLKVMDFGVARVLGAARSTRHGQIVGTVEYMSPEQIKGEEADARSDIYSLGILLYEMLTGRAPFNSTSEYELMKEQVEKAPPPPTVFAAHIPLAVEEPIMRALAKKPEARFKSALEFRAALLAAIGKNTNPLDYLPSGYAAPATRVSHTDILGAAPPVSGDARRDKAEPDEVILSEGDPAPQRVVPVADNAALDKAVPDNAASNKAAADKSAPARATAQQQASTQAQPSVPFFKRLNWSHYTAASILLLLIASVPFALMSRNSREPAPQLPAATRPPGVSQTNQNAAQQNQAASDASPASAENSNTDASALPPPDAQPSAVNSNAQGETAATVEPSARNSNAQPRSAKDEKSATANKNAQKKDGGIGGFFKKINPFKRGKKQQKKP